MTERSGPGSTVWRAICLVMLLASLLLLGSLAPHLRHSAGLVKLRNALLIEAPPASHDWTPASVPADFDLDRGQAPALFTRVVQQQGLRDVSGDWPTALAIARHLLSGGRRSSGPIQSDLADTYRRIVERGEGYCGDYADVFTALANASGVFSRSWAFSFDGFGGHGHIFNEVWDAQSGQWRMLDIHNNVRPVDAAQGRALSAIELRDRLLARQPVRWLPIEPRTRPGYVLDHLLVEYYRRGLPQWYLWWGSNVFEYDEAFAVKALAPVHRGAEQLGGIVAGVHRGLRVLPTPDSAAAREALVSIRWRLLALPVVLLIAAVAGLVWWQRARRGRLLLRARHV